MKIVFAVLLCNIIIVADSEPSLIESRIIGGSRVFHDKRNHSFVVSVVMIVENGEFSSGGSLISTKHVLTVAHTIYSIRQEKKYDLKGVCVVVGSTTLNPRDGTVYTAVHIDIHVGYIPNKDPIYADIALLTIMPEVRLSESVSIIELPTSETECDEEVTAFGWGCEEIGNELENRSLSNMLKVVTLKTIDNTACQEKWSDFVIISSQICTVPKTEGETVYIGDSGGPLVQGNKLIGIASWCHPHNLTFPAVFTRVSYYLGYIKQAKERSAQFLSNNKNQNTLRRSKSSNF